jgi:uncharacterized membrane protein
MTSRTARTVRGLLTAAFAVFVAAFSHVAAGGQTPGSVGVVLALAFASLASIALAGKTLSRARLTISVLFSQLVLHVLFGVGAAGGAIVAGQSSHHGGMVTLETASTAATSGSGMSAAMHGGMWLAHAFAALITIVALQYGEKAFWGLVEQARTRVVSVLISLQPVFPVAVSTAVLRPVVTRNFLAADPGVVLSSLLRRGPPAILGAV